MVKIKESEHVNDQGRPVKDGGSSTEDGKERREDGAVEARRSDGTAESARAPSAKGQGDEADVDLEKGRTGNSPPG